MHIFVYITAADQDEAGRIARHLVEHELAACVNILPPVRSVYRWQGAIEEATECAVICKTRRACFGPLREAVRAMHSYDTPCIVALPLVEGDADFLAWVDANTRA